MMRLAQFKSAAAAQKRRCPFCGLESNQPKLIMQHMKAKHDVVEWEDLSEDV